MLNELSRKGRFSASRLAQVGCQPVSFESLGSPGQSAGRKIDPGKAARTTPRPFHMISSHTDADLKDVLAASFLEAGEVTNVRL